MTSLEMDEDFRADCREAEVPDEVWRQVKCAACGCIFSKDDGERRGHDWLCPECAAEVALIEEISR